MKIFNHLSETERDRAIHYIQHDVIDSLLEDGLDGKPETDEDKKEFEEMQAALEDIRKLEGDKQISACFENDALWDLSFSIAMDIAQGAYFLEPNETHYHLDQIENAFEDDDDDEGSETDEVVEKEIAEIIPFPSKKPSNTLN
jgi:hypothetical protein